MSGSPISIAQKERDAARKEVARLNAIIERNTMAALAAEASAAHEKKRLATIAARWELRAIMISSVFSAELKHVAEDVDNARTLNELKTWIRDDLIARWNAFIVSAKELDNMDADEWESRAANLSASSGITFNPESIQRNMREILAEYGVS